ncbi:MAG: SusC/RagA family TonB-linked outer membrane protein [Cyclobacteriaceae bacterium]
MINIYKQKRRSLWHMGLVFLLAFSALLAQAQEVVVTGKVTDAETQQGLPGAAVRVVGTTNGTVTDTDGNFSLSVASSGLVKIEISFVGYASVTTEFANGSTVINVALKPEYSALDEVVVTGSTLKSAKRELGNNITSVSSSMIERSGANNLFNALQGKVPGAQITQNSGDPAGGMTIRLRGVKSLSGPSDPLYVIDGVIVSNSTANVSQTALGNQVGEAAVGNNRLVDINPSDIETLNVINGAAAAAQYGSRASNGVVLITTKKGKSGAPRISFSTSVTMNELRKKVPISTYGKQFGSVGLRLHPIQPLSTAWPALPGETFVPVTRENVVSNLRTNLVDVTRYDYQDQIFQKGYGTDNNLSINGGNDKTQYFASISYSRNEGIIRGTDFTRYNIRTRIEQRLADWAKMSVGLSYANTFSNEKANGNVFYSPINSINITNNIYDITQRNPANGKLQAVEATRVNPLSTIEDMNFTQAVNRTVNDLQLNLTPIKGLGIDWIIGVDAFTQNGRGLIRPYPYQAVAGLPAERYPTGYASNASNSVLQFNTDLNVSYEKQLTSDLKLNAIIGGSYQYQRTDFQRASGEGVNALIETISGASSAVTAGYGLPQFSLSGYFAQATLGYKNLAFITAAVRRDQSSIFSESERTQTYPKVSGSFVVSDLDFWKNTISASTVSSLKLRSSWGQAGNLVGLDPFSRFWQFQPTPYLGRNTIVPSSQLANPNVRPELMSEFEFGTDIAFWNNRVNLGATFYNQSISDLVVSRGTASSEGGLSIVNNVGTMENNGFEISLNIVPIKTQNFTWDVTFIYNQNRNKVTKLGSPTISIGNSAGAPVFLIEGAPASVFYGTTIARDGNGNPLLTPQGFLQNERGVQSSLTPLTYAQARDAVTGQPVFGPGVGAVRTIIGDPNPDWTGSLMSNLSYKNLSFNFLLDAVQGVEVFNADKRTRENVGIGPIAEQEMKGEIVRGYIFAIGPIEEWRVDNGSFVKLREIGLSYNLKNPIKGINSVNIGLSGRNLISWDSYNGYDPETNAGGNSDRVRGVDFGNVPIPRTYKAQITFSF